MTSNQDQPRGGDCRGPTWNKRNKTRRLIRGQWNEDPSPKDVIYINYMGPYNSYYNKQIYHISQSSRSTFYMHLQNYEHVRNSWKKKIRIEKIVVIFTDVRLLLGLHRIHLVSCIFVWLYFITLFSTILLMLITYLTQSFKTFN